MDRQEIFLPQWLILCVVMHAMYNTVLRLQQ